MRTFPLALTLTLTLSLASVSRGPANAQSYYHPIPRNFYPQRSTYINPQRGTYANPPRALYLNPGYANSTPNYLQRGLGANYGAPPAAPRYNSPVNGISSSIIYSRIAQRSAAGRSREGTASVHPLTHYHYALATEESSTPPDLKQEAESLTSARESFKAGELLSTVGYANEAIQASPLDPAAHEAYALAMFALGDYHVAALAAHAVLHCGQPAKWPTIADWYRQPAKYYEQLRSLESRVKQQPQDAAAAFLLGYHYLMLGHKAEAATQLKAALKLSPDDLQAKKLLAALAPNAAPASSPPPVPLPGEGTSDYQP